MKKIFILLVSAFFVTQMFARPVAMQKAVSFAPKPMSKSEIKKSESKADFFLSELPDGVEKGGVYIGAFLTKENSQPEALCIVKIEQGFEEVGYSAKNGVKLAVKSKPVSDGNIVFLDLDIFARSMSAAGKSASWQKRVQCPSGRFAVPVCDETFKNIFPNSADKIVWVLFRP